MSSLVAFETASRADVLRAGLAVAACARLLGGFVVRVDRGPERACRIVAS
jgi:hypothetical protein